MEPKLKNLVIKRNLKTFNWMCILIYKSPYRNQVRFFLRAILKLLYRQINFKYCHFIGNSSSALPYNIWNIGNEVERVTQESLCQTHFSQLKKNRSFYSLLMFVSSHFWFSSLCAKVQSYKGSFEAMLYLRLPQFIIIEYIVFRKC